MPGLNYFKVRLWLNLFLMIVPGTIFLLLLKPYHYLLSQISNSDIFVAGSIMISYSFLSYSCTLFILSQLNIREFNFEKWISYSIRLGRREQSNLLWQMVLLSVSIILVFLYIGFIPQVYYLDNKILIHRANISSLFSGFKFFIDVVQLGAVIVCYKALVYVRLRPSLFTKLVFFYSALITIAILTYKLEKGPLVFFLLGLFVVYSYLGYRFKVRIIFSIFLILLLFIGYLYKDWLFLLMSFDKNMLFTGLFGRIFIAPTMGFYLMLDSFPSTSNFLFFSSYSNRLSWILGIEHSERAARLIQYVYNSAQVNDGTAGVINSYYLGEAWASFGVFGVILSPIIVAVTSFFSFMLISGRRVSINSVSILAALTFASLMFGGFNDFLYNLTFMLYLAFRILKVIIKL